MRFLLSCVWLVATCFFAFTAPSFATPQKIDHVQVDLISDSTSVQKGQSVRVGVRYVMDEKWHIYWRNPGDSGLPTDITWDVPEGVTYGPLRHGTPEVIPMPPLVNYGYHHEALLYTTLTIPEDYAANNVDIVAQTRFLMCKDICLPGEATVRLNLPVSDAPTQGSYTYALFETYEAKQPLRPQNWGVEMMETDEKYVLTMPVPDTFKKGKKAVFLPYREGIINDSIAQQAAQNDERFVLHIGKDLYLGKEEEEIAGLVMVDGQAYEIHAPVIPYDAAKDVAPTTAQPFALYALLSALFFAFVGGVILNLMPCVLPVLSLKAMGLVHHAHSKTWQGAYGLAYTAGVLLMFFLLAGALVLLKAGGAQVGWGFQLQSPLFVAILALILLLIALELFRVFEVGSSMGRVMNWVKGKENLTTTFLSGVLIVVVATPCTVPFMGSAVAYSLTQSTPITLAVFAALGLGLAAPYLLLTFVPSLLKFIPKPGPWEEKFQQFLGFPILATALWLVWVYGRQTSLDATFMLMLAAFVVAFGAWVLGRFGHIAACRGTRYLAYLVFGASLASALGLIGAWKPFAPSQKEEALSWAPWSTERVETARNAGQAVFVNFTADWCITCKVNEHAVLSTQRVKDTFATQNVLLLKADWTLKNERISAELETFGRRGVPLYVAYPQAGEAKILPQILTPSAIENAFKPSKPSTQ